MRNRIPFLLVTLLLLLSRTSWAVSPEDKGPKPLTEGASEANYEEGFKDLNEQTFATIKKPNFLNDSMDGFSSDEELLDEESSSAPVNSKQTQQVPTLESALQAIQTVILRASLTVPQKVGGLDLVSYELSRKMARGIAISALGWRPSSRMWRDLNLIQDPRDIAKYLEETITQPGIYSDQDAATAFAFAVCGAAEQISTFLSKGNLDRNTLMSVFAMGQELEGVLHEVQKDIESNRSRNSRYYSIRISQMIEIVGEATL